MVWYGVKGGFVCISVDVVVKFVLVVFDEVRCLLEVFERVGSGFVISDYFVGGWCIFYCVGDSVFCSFVVVIVDFFVVFSGRVNEYWVNVN